MMMAGLPGWKYFAIVFGIVIGMFMIAVQLHPNIPYVNQYIGIRSENNYSILRMNTKDSLDDDERISRMLREKVRVLCWILTGTANHATRAQHIKATWCKRCDKCLFMSSTADPNLPTVALNVSEGRGFLWGKTKQAFKYIYDHENISNYDWFLKADDDTYVIMENLRFMLLPQKTEKPIYFGCKFKLRVPQGYNSGGAGYVLSRAALKKFVTEALPNKTLCRQDDYGDEDGEMGECLNNVGVKNGDTRDAAGLHRFLPDVPESFLFPNPSYLFLGFTYYPLKQGLNCCSDYPISFHYIGPKQIYTLEYFTYHVKVFGMPKSGSLLPKNADWKFVERLALENIGPDDAMKKKPRSIA